MVATINGTPIFTPLPGTPGAQTSNLGVTPAPKNTPPVAPVVKPVVTPPTTQPPVTTQPPTTTPSGQNNSSSTGTGTQTTGSGSGSTATLTPEQTMQQAGWAPTNDPNLNNLIASNIQTGQQLGTGPNSILNSYYGTNGVISRLMNGPLQLNPEQSTMLSVMNQTNTAAAQLMTQAADASTAVTREALARSGATQTSPKTAASEIALSIQAGAQQVQMASLNGAMAIAQYESSIRSGQIEAAQSFYSAYEGAVKDQQTATNQMFQAMNEHYEFASNYALAAMKANIEEKTLALNVGEATSTTTSTKPNFLQSIMNAVNYQPNTTTTTKTLGGGSTSSPSATSFPSGVTGVPKGVTYSGTTGTYQGKTVYLGSDGNYYD